MSEGRVVDPARREPNTRRSLARELRSLGLHEGELLLCHSSLSALGWCCGGAVAVVQALMDVLGSEGTLVVPSHSSDLSEPSNWCNPPIPEAWWPIVRDEMPAYDPDLTPTRAMGAIPNCLLRHPERLRSEHPQVSFAALGPRAEGIVARHALSPSMGDGSPLARLYEEGARGLLLGVGHDRNTSLHLAEARASWPGKRMKGEGAPMRIDGRRCWQPFEDLDWDEEDFSQVGEAFERACPQAWVRAPVGATTALLFHQPALVDFAVGWFEKHRK